MEDSGESFSNCLLKIFCLFILLKYWRFGRRPFLKNEFTLIRGVNQKVFFSRSIAVLRHKTERNLGMMLQNTIFFLSF